MNNIYLSEFESYLSIDLNYSNNTVNTYNNNLSRFNDFIGTKDLLKVTNKDIEKYITNFAICYIKNRDLRRIEYEWNSIIYNGLKRIVNLNSQKKGKGEHAQAILSNSDYKISKSFGSCSAFYYIHSWRNGE
jgi:hypothetical protein